MKRFNDIMNKYMYMSFIKRWLISIPFLFVFFCVVVYSLLRLTLPESNTNGVIELTIIGVAELALFLSVIMGLFVAFMYGAMGDSVKFWNAARAFGAKIESIEDKEELKEYFDSEFSKVCKMANGGPHSIELHRLYTIASTKYKYMCNKKQ